MSICQIDEDGNKIWKNKNGQFHCEDGPAIEYANGSIVWFLNGQFHREDGPAYERADGSKFWYLKNQFHREDGPAIERSNGDREWYLNGRQYSFKDYCNELLERKLITASNLTLFRIKHGE